MPIVWDEVDRIELDDGEWVDIKQKMSYGDLDRLEANMGKAIYSPEVTEKMLKNADAIRKGDIQLSPEELTDFEYSTGKLALLTVNIRAWSFKDKKGKALAVNKNTVAMLDSATAEKLLDEIGKRNPKAA